MAVELQINNSANARARYVGWAPALCRIRQTPGPMQIKVKLDNAGTQGKVAFYGTGAKPNATSTTNLIVTLPIGGAWASFWMGGQWGSPSVEDGDAAVRVQTVLSPKVVLTQKLMVRIRKNANTLTAGERDRFIAALAKLNNAGAGLFQTFRDMHTAAGDAEAHRRSGFLPWHRTLLLDLERELQNVDASVAMPYWRFDQPAPNIFKKEFLGEASATSGSVVFSASNPLQFWKTDGVPGVQRSPAFDTSTGAPSLLSEAQTLALGTSFANFRTLEGNPHGWAHADSTSFSAGWIMSISTAAKDPLFFLLHCNVDRLWAKWQWLGNRFDPGVATNYDTAGATRVGHRLADSMWPWNGITTSPRPPTAPGGGLASSPCAAAPGETPIVQSQLDYQGRLSPGSRLGFDYDDVPYA